jgi:hypothetical protein
MHGQGLEPGAISQRCTNKKGAVHAPIARRTLSLSHSPWIIEAERPVLAAFSSLDGLIDRHSATRPQTELQMRALE